MTSDKYRVDFRETSKTVYCFNGVEILNYLQKKLENEERKIRWGIIRSGSGSSSSNAKKNIELI